jgi:hypothetical protein
VVPSGWKIKRQQAIATPSPAPVASQQGNLNTSFSGTFHAFNFEKCARRYIGGFCFRFNLRF